MPTIQLTLIWALFPSVGLAYLLAAGWVLVGCSYWDGAGVSWSGSAHLGLHERFSAHANVIGLGLCQAVLGCSWSSARVLGGLLACNLGCLWKLNLGKMVD